MVETDRGPRMCERENFHGDVYRFHLVKSYSLGPWGGKDHIV